MTVFFFLDNIGVNAMYITVKKIKHNKIDKGGEGEEGGNSNLRQSCFEK